MRILFTTPILEYPPAGGPALRIANTVKALERICELHVISRAPAYDVKDFRFAPERFAFAPSVNGLSSNRIFRRLQRLFRRGGHQDDARYLVDYAARNSINAIWFGFGNISWPVIEAVRAIQPGLKVVCDTDSVWSRFILRELDVETDPARRARIQRAGAIKEAEERAWTALCDVTLAVSEVDAEYYRAITDNPARVMVFQNTIDVEAYPPVSPPAGFASPSLLLSGTFGHAASPMDRAARWMLGEVMPHLWARVPRLHLYIVGKDSDRTLADARSDRVTVTGKVPSLLPYLHHADVSVVPLQFESGTRFKILEAGICRRPVVSTTLGAEGLPVVDGTDLLIADRSADFADAVLTLLYDPAKRAVLGSNLHAMVQEQFGVDALVRQGQAVLQALR